MFLCVKIVTIKILKELSRKEFRDKFGTVAQFLTCLAKRK
jgi:hypothetical protein